jgi:hypothetical protein
MNSHELACTRHCSHGPAHAPMCLSSRRLSAEKRRSAEAHRLRRAYAHIHRAQARLPGERNARMRASQSRVERGAELCLRVYKWMHAAGEEVRGHPRQDMQAWAHAPEYKAQIHFPWRARIHLHSHSPTHTHAYAYGHRGCAISHTRVCLVDICARLSIAVQRHPCMHACASTRPGARCVCPRMRP